MLMNHKDRHPFFFTFPLTPCVLVVLFTFLCIRLPNLTTWVKPRKGKRVKIKLEWLY